MFILRLRSRKKSIVGDRVPRPSALVRSFIVGSGISHQLEATMNMEKSVYLSWRLLLGWEWQSCGHSNRLRVAFLIAITIGVMFLRSAFLNFRCEWLIVLVSFHFSDGVGVRMVVVAIMLNFLHTHPVCSICVGAILFSLHPHRGWIWHVRNVRVYSRSVNEQKHRSIV